MNIDIIVVGKTDDQNVGAIVDTYLKRLNFYTKVKVITLPDPKNTRNISADSQKRTEGETILKLLTAADHVILLDEGGTQMRSMDFAEWMQKKMNSGIRRLCFIIGGPYGFSKDVYARADGKLSLSMMTFSHQIIRAIFTEQLYRAFTILNNEPYHHE